MLATAMLTTFAAMAVSPFAAADVDAAGYYKLRCATCHGANGEGTRDKSPSLGPPLRGNPFVINAPAEMLINVIRHGRGGQQRVYDDAYPNMPAFDAGMVPDALGLANYLKGGLQQQATARTNPGEPVRKVSTMAAAVTPGIDAGETRESADRRAETDPQARLPLDRPRHSPLRTK
jgi:mono/diheme cytochrome c family protein